MIMGTDLIAQSHHSDLAAIEQLPTLNAAAYDAASLDDRSIGNWAPWPASADADMYGETEIMTGRSRDLFRNNPIASGAKQTLKDNVIGAILRLVAMPDYHLLGNDKEWAHDWAKNTQAEFRSWADTPECDAAGRLNLLGLSLQALDSAFQGGDGLALARWTDRPGSRWKTRLQVVEGDRLTTPPGMDSKRGLRAGVQQDQYGMPLGYHIMKNHPGDKWGMMGYAADEWTYIPAYTSWGRRQVLHIYDAERAGQSRGKTVLASVVKAFKMAGKYSTTELETAIANSIIAGIMESDLDQDSIHSIFAAGGGNVPPGMSQEEYKYNQFIGGWKGRLAGGAVLRTPPGTKLSLYNTGRNNQAFEAFMTTVLRYIATGLNMPYELLMKDFSETNYSSARAALLEAWRYFNGRRRWFSDYWLNEVYALWLEEAVNNGRVDAPDFYEHKYAYSRCRWIMAGRGWVDPVKEANAAKLRMDIGISTLQQECAEQGLDWEEVLEQRAHERRLISELGLLQSESAVYAPVSQETDNEDGANPNNPDDSKTADAMNGAPELEGLDGAAATGSVAITDAIGADPDPNIDAAVIANAVKQSQSGEQHV
jgi:lambda family phage portal protein